MRRARLAAMMNAKEALERMTSEAPNVGNPERWGSVVIGGALMSYGVSRRTVSGTVLALLGGVLVWRGATGECPVYRQFGLSTAPENGGDRQVSVPYGKGFAVEEAVTVEATPERLYTFWRNFENLPRFMQNLESVTVQDRTRSHWVAKGPIGIDAQWDAEIINEVPNELIGWRSVGGRVDNAGSVHFTPVTGNRATEVRVILRYDPPGGPVGAAVAKLFGEDPAHQVREDLRRFKELMETGSVVTS